MKRMLVILAVIAVSTLTVNHARAETAIGAVFGYPGNAGVSVRMDRMPINAAWSNDFFHATIDMWMSKKQLKGADGKLSWYWGPGADLGFPLNNDHDFFLAARVPFGLQYMASPKLELFGELAPGIQLLDTTDFYWAGDVGIRFVLGK